MCVYIYLHRVTIPWARIQKTIPYRSWDDWNTCMAREPTAFVPDQICLLRARWCLGITNTVTATFAPWSLDSSQVFPSFYLRFGLHLFPPMEVRHEPRDVCCLNLR